MKKIVIANSQSWFQISKKISELDSIVIAEVKDNDSLLSIVEALQPDFVFAPHWNSFIPDSITSSFETVIFHTAPLPIGRGGSPIQNLILSGYSIAPVNALKATSGLDAGPIFAKQDVSLEGSLSQIFKRMNGAVNSLIFQMLTNKLEPIEQVGDPTYFNRRSPEQSKVEFQGRSLTEIYDHIRMLDADSYPRAFINAGEYTLEFSKSELLVKDAVKATVTIKFNPHGEQLRPKHTHNNP